MLAGVDLVAMSVMFVVATTRSAPLAEAAVFVVILGLGRLYRSRLNASALETLPRLAAFCTLGTIPVVTVFDPDDSLVHADVLAIKMTCLLFVVRIVYFALVRRRRRSSPSMRSRTAIIGGGTVSAKLLDSLEQHPELGLEPVVVVDNDPLPEIGDWGVPVDPRVDRLRDIVTDLDIETVIVAFTRHADKDFVAPLRDCDDLDCEVFIVPRLFEFVHLAGDMERVHTVPLVHVRRNAQRTWCWQAKRLVDLTVALLTIVLVAPVLLTCAAAVFVTDPSGPVIFRQRRIGRQGTPFDLYKFRSMRSVSTATSDTDWNVNRERRLTPIGALLRKTSLDELPQLWNVVKGDMSLVGPRPERPHFVEQFANSVPSYGHRHRVHVGLTGWAAIHGLRGDTSIDDRALYDNFYIENWSVWLDVKIVLLTFRAVLRGTGS
jgi:exopolysaccharide biosynthesis polyprenyl glycosylphosphotransferase